MKLNPSIFANGEWVKLYGKTTHPLRFTYALSRGPLQDAAGANAICELLALRKPNLLIPLSARASRGDQILNAHSFERQGFSLVIEEEQLTNATLLDAVHNLYENREQFINAMHNSGQQDPIATIIGLIEEAAAK